MKITATFLDGSSETIDTSTYMALTDRMAFERRFNKNVLDLRGLAEAIGEDGKLSPTADLSVLREEWLAFFTWRVMGREIGDVGAFEDFVEKVAALDFVGPDAARQETEEDEGLDPTDQDPPTD